MGVVSPERERAAPPRAPRPPARRAFPWGLAAALVGVVVLLVGARDWLPDLLPSFPNPFEETTVDRSRPAVLKSIRDVGEFHGASAHFEAIVDLERDTPLPAALLGTRTLFVAVGDVDAVVDFTTVGENAIQVSDDRRSATITLPPPRLSPVQLDVGESYVYDRQRGVLNEIGGLFSDDANAQRELYVIAQRKLEQAARETPEIRRRAARNTRAMLDSMLQALGFTSVTVRFRSG